MVVAAYLVADASPLVRLGRPHLESPVEPSSCVVVVAVLSRQPHQRVVREGVFVVQRHHHPVALHAVHLQQALHQHAEPVAELQRGAGAQPQVSARPHVDVAVDDVPPARLRREPMRQPSAERAAAVEVHLQRALVVGGPRAVQEVVLERRVVLDAREVVAAVLVEDARYDRGVVGAAPPLRVRRQLDALVAQVRREFVARVGILQRVAHAADVARRHDHDRVDARPLVEARERAANHVVAKPVEEDVERLAGAALREARVHDVEPGVRAKLVARHVVADVSACVDVALVELVAVVEQQHVARVPLERVVRDAPDDAEDRRDLHRMPEVAHERVVRHREVGDVRRADGAETRLKLDATAAILLEQTVVHHRLARPAVVPHAHPQPLVEPEPGSENKSRFLLCNFFSNLFQFLFYIFQLFFLYFPICFPFYRWKIYI